MTERNLLTLGKLLLSRSILALLLVQSAKAQFGSFNYDQPFLARDVTTSIPIPEQIPDLCAWWLYTDMATNTFQVTSWTDRIAGIVATNYYTAPTNFTLGVYFERSTGLRVNYTNATYNKFSNCTTCVIFRPVVNNDFDVLYRDSISSDFKVRRYTAGAWRAGDGTEATCFTDPAYNIYHDLIVVRTNGSSITIYTNGIVTAYVNVARLSSTMPQEFASTGSAATRGLEGYITDILYYTNNFSAASISNFHYYATNTYGYSP